MEEDAEKDSDAELYENSEESSDEERSWVKEVKKQHKMIRKKHQDEETPEVNDEDTLYELSSVPQSRNIVKSITRVNKTSLGNRLAKEGFSTIVTGSGGNREMKFNMRGKKSASDDHKKMKRHHQERKQFVRRTGFLMKKKLPKMS